MIPVSLLGLPMMHVLVVTHLFGCVEIEIIASFLPGTKETEPGARWLTLKPGFPSMIRLPGNTNTIPISHAQVITGLSRILKAIPLH